MLREVETLLGENATDAVFAYGDPGNGVASYAHQPESARLRVRATVVQTSEVVCVGTDPVATITHRRVSYCDDLASGPKVLDSWRYRMWCCDETHECDDHDGGLDQIDYHLRRCRGDL